MLYLIYGEDSYRARKNVREIAANLILRNPGAAVHRLTPENSNEENLADLIYGQNLFGQKSVIVFDGLLEGELGGFLEKKAKDAADSKNVYIILDGKLDAGLAKKISKFAQKTLKLNKLSPDEIRGWIVKEAKEREISLSAGEIDFFAKNFESDLWAVSQALELKSLGGEIDIKKFLYNPFGLADLFAQRNKREAYKLFHKNLSSGVTAEEMFWKLWWQMRTLLAVSSFKESGFDNFQIKASAGLHPYVIQKSLSAASRFRKDELARIWDELFAIWRGSREGNADLESGLERVILGLA